MVIRFISHFSWWIGLGGLALLLISLVVRHSLKKELVYVFPYVQQLKKRMVRASYWYAPSKIAFICHMLSFGLLIGALMRPVIVDEKSRIHVEGRDIVMVLDMSGSMQLFDDPRDRRSRFEVAKAELVRFIERRVDDALGLVVFGATAFSRCPLTQDKKLLQLMVDDLELGMINPEGTVLSGALAMAINRLKASKSASKVVVMLTDGAPSPQDIAPGPVIALAQKLGVKVYTIGVGSTKGGFAEVPFQGLVQCQTPLNKELLETIARQTGGAFFSAERPEELAAIYKTIDALEKTAQDVPRYARFYELFPFVLMGALCCLFGEWVIRWWWVF